MTESAPPPPPAPDNLVPLAPGVSAEPSALRYSFSRSGGPGGQAVNKLATKAELRIRVGDLRGLDEAAAGRLRRLAGSRLTQADEIIVVAETHRSQLDNRRACLTKLQAMVTEAARTPKPRKKRRPSRAQIERRLEAKRQRAERKQSRRRMEE